MTPAITTDSDECCIHEGQIPRFVEQALDELYGSLYASLPQLSFGGLDGVSTYAERKAGRLHALFLYLRERSSIRVINEGMAIEADTAIRFADAMFSREPRAACVSFRAIRFSGTPAGRPTVSLAKTEDIVLDLPRDESAYLASLGKSTRKTLRQNLARAQKLVHAVIPGREVEGALVDAIIGFNRARMADKHRRSAVDAKAREQLLSLVRARGLAGTVTLDGRMCAGTLACRIGDDLYSLLNAHDPALNSIGLGNIARHLMIIAAIRDGVQRFHLLGGHFPSKRPCGAGRVPLHDLLIYRNMRSMLSDIGRIASLTAQAAAYRIRCAAEDEQTRAQAPWPERAAAHIARLLRNALHARREKRASTS